MESVKKSPKIICECGAKITKKSLKRHKRTKKHLRIMEEVKERKREYVKHYRDHHKVEKVQCECGCILRQDRLKEHKKTPNHWGKMMKTDHN